MMEKEDRSEVDTVPIILEPHFLGERGEESKFPLEYHCAMKKGP